MKNQKLASKICRSVKSDARVLSSIQEIIAKEDETLEDWARIMRMRRDGASLKDTLRTMIPLETELFKLKLASLNLMKEIFEENRICYVMTKKMNFFDYFLHPLNDKALMEIIENLIKTYENICSYRQNLKEMAKKMNDVGLRFTRSNHCFLVTSGKPRDVVLLEEEEELEMLLAAQFIEAERLKISIELSALNCRDIGQRFLNLLKTVPPTKTTRGLAIYFESLAISPAIVSNPSRKG